MSDENENRATAGLCWKLLLSVFIAGCIIAWGLSKSAEYQREAYNQTREYSEDTYTKVADACIGKAIVEKAVCLNDARHERRDNERNEYELVAQRQSALWAYIMGAAAVIGMAVSSLGVWLVYTTYIATKKTADITRDLYTLETKPFLTIRPIDGMDFFWRENGRIGVKRGFGRPSRPVLCEIKNNGRGHAILTGIYRTWHANTIGEPPPPIDADCTAVRNRVAINQLPISVDGVLLPALSEEGAPFVEGQWLTFYGFAEYEDLGRNRFRSGFAFNYDPINCPDRGLITARFKTNGYWYYKPLGKEDKEEA